MSFIWLNLQRGGLQGWTWLSSWRHWQNGIGFSPELDSTDQRGSDPGWQPTVGHWTTWEIWRHSTQGFTGDSLHNGQNGNWTCFHSNRQCLGVEINTLLTSTDLSLLRRFSLVDLYEWKQASLPTPMSPGWQTSESLDLNNAWQSVIINHILNRLMNTWFRKSHVINPLFSTYRKRYIYILLIVFINRKSVSPTPSK